MATDFAKSWVYDGVTTSLDNPDDGIVEQWDEDEYRRNIPSESDAEGREWQGDSVPDSRTVTVPLYVEGTDRDALRAAWQVLAMAFDQPGEGKLYLHSDRYLVGRFNSLRKQVDEGANYVLATVGIKCADPYWYAGSTVSATLTISTNSVTITSGARPIPVFSFQTTGAGNLTVAHDGQTFVLAIAASGVYAVDCGAGTVTKDGVAAMSLMSGEFIEDGLKVGSTSIVVSKTGSLALTTGSVTYRPRWAHTA